MEATEATAEMADAGVNTSDSISEETSPVSEDTNQNKEQVEASDQDAEEVLPFGKHPRWQKMTQANRELKQQLESFKSQSQQLQSAANLEKALRSDPKYAALLYGIFDGKDPQALLQEFMGQTKDPYAEYEPDVAERFRKFDALEKKLADQEKGAVSQRQASIDREFDNLLKKDGWISGDGNPIDNNAVDLISLGIKSYMMNNFENWQSPSDEQFHEAYKVVMDGVRFLQEFSSKQALKKIVKTDVPASGSRQGAPPSGKAARTDQDRIMDIANAL